MANPVYDKGRSIKTVIVCLLISAGSAFVFTHFANIDAAHPLFIIGTIFLGLFFLVGCIGAIVLADDDRYGNALRGFVIAMTAAIFLWFGGWAAFSNEEVKPGSVQMESK